jgi:hypothetical protein
LPPGRPEASDKSAEQNGDHQRFQPGLTESKPFNILKPCGGGRDQNAEAQAWNDRPDPQRDEVENLKFGFFRLLHSK